MSDKTFEEALAETIEGVAGSTVFVNLFHPSMADFEKNPWPAIQLAIAILLDKPIILACPRGRQPPERLRRVADHVVCGTPEEIAIAIQRIVGETTGEQCQTDCPPSMGDRLSAPLGDFIEEEKRHGACTCEPGSPDDQCPTHGLEAWRRERDG